MTSGPASRPPRQMRSTARLMALLALAFLPAPALADPFGDVIATVEEQPPGESSHGYAEYWIRIENRSKDASHEVKLTMPKFEESHYGDFIRAVTRTVAIEPGKTVHVSLAYPERLAVSGSTIGVAIDGRDFDNPLRLLHSSLGYSSRISYGYGSRSTPPALILCSKSIDPRFSTFANSATSVTNRNFPVAALPPSDWSPNWLGYSRYDGVVLTADDLRAMPAETRNAIGQYVECGGVLLIFGEDAPLPGSWKLESNRSIPIKSCAAGFGTCFVSQEQEPWSMDRSALGLFLNATSLSSSRLQRIHAPGQANKLFPVVDDLGVPVRGLLLLMGLFTVVIGPVNLFILTRMKRRLWLFWTVPAVSAITCVAVLGSMIFSEGFSGKIRVESITLLDENSRRATTLGWFADYTPLLSGGGLHFSTQTEVSYQNEDDSSGYSYRRRRDGAALTIDWTKDQNLASGWVAPRVPSHFELRKSDARRERVVIAATSDGKLEAVNGLGADVHEFTYVNNAGAYFTAQTIPAGGRAVLTRTSGPTLGGSPQSLQTLFNGEWFAVNSIKSGAPGGLLKPRMYLAFLDSSPFLDEIDTKGATVRARAAVIGIQKEGE